MENRDAAAIYLRIFRGVVIYAVFALVSSLALLFFVFFSYSLTDRPLGEQLDLDMFQFPFIVQTVLLPLFLSSLIRIFAERDAVMKELLYPGADEVGTMRQCMRAVLACKYFWIQLAALTLPLTVLPMEVGFYPLKFLFSHTVLPDMVQKVIFLAVLLPLLFCLSLWHHANAFYVWQEQEIAQRPDNSRQFFLPVLATAAFYAAFLLLLPPLLTILLNALLSLLAISFSFIGVLILGAILLFLLIRYLRAVAIRFTFLQNLRKRCEKNGFSLSKINRPYRSLFRMKDGVDFTVEAHGKTFSCKLLAAPSRGNAMALSPEGIAYVIHIVGLRILPRRSTHISSEFLGGARNVLGGTRWYSHMELFRFTTKTDFSFEGAGQRILIVNPVPYALFVGTDQYAQPIDNGAAVGSYKVFAGSAFLNALERDCIHKT